VGRNGKALKAAGRQERQQAAAGEHTDHQRCDKPVQQARNQAISVLGIREHADLLVLSTGRWKCI
jgi:hypothetical protein